MVLIPRVLVSSEIKCGHKVRSRFVGGRSSGRGAGGVWVEVGHWRHLT